MNRYSYQHAETSRPDNFVNFAAAEARKWEEKSCLYIYMVRGDAGRLSSNSHYSFHLNLWNEELVC